MNLFLQLLANGVTLSGVYTILGLSFGLIFNTTRVFHLMPAALIDVSAKGASPYLGVIPLVVATIVVFIGGIGVIPAAAISGLFLGILENISVFWLPSQWQETIAFLVLIVFLIFRPMGFFPPDQGQVWFKGAPLRGKSAHHIVAMGIARTFQELRLFDSISVVDNIVLAMKGQPGEHVVPLFFHWLESNYIENRCKARARELLQFVGMGHVADAAASDLSYGQQKRVALARVLASDPDLICLDEPAAGLDPGAVESMVELIRRLVERGKTILLVEHNLEIVKQLCDKVLFMDQGRLVVEGPPEIVLNDPRVFRSFMGI